jgi:hypothetical protein
MVAARLADGGDLEAGIAGKPGCYRGFVVQALREPGFCQKVGSALFKRSTAL